jgi:hypothetical protein
MKTTQRYLDILGIRPGVTRDELKAAYRAMIQISHPDRFQGNEALRTKAEEQTRLVNEAYAYLMANFEQTAPGAIASGPDEPVRDAGREDRNGPRRAEEAKNAQQREYRRRKARREAEEARRAAAAAEHDRKVRQTVVLGILFLVLLVLYAAHARHEAAGDGPPGVRDPISEPVE